MCIHVLHGFCNFLCVKFIDATQKFHLIFIVRTNVVTKGEREGRMNKLWNGIKI